MSWIMTWAEYVAWWQDPMNIFHMLWSMLVGAVMYWLGYRNGHMQGRAKGREDAIYTWLGAKLLWPGKFEPKKEHKNEN